MSHIIGSHKWEQDEFLISTDQRLLQPDSINEAMSADFMYWCNAPGVEKLSKMLSKSFCFGVYIRNSLDCGNVPDKQIGLARLITDETTFAYLTDVYILPEYTGRGLGKWLISCVQEELSEWPDLRGILLYADEGKAIQFYERFLGTREFPQGEKGLKILCRWYDASPLTGRERGIH